MASSIEKSTITVKTAVLVTAGLLSIAGSIAGSYWASGHAVEKKLLELHYADLTEAQERKHADVLLARDIAANTKAIEGLSLRADAMGPTTVTTFRGQR